VASFSIISQWFGASVVSIPLFPSVTNWKELNANGHKFRLNPARLVTQLCPHTPILIANYKPWIKTSQTLFRIDPGVGIDSCLKFIPTAVMKTQCVPHHSFPLFVNKRVASFYAGLTILLTVVPRFFFNYVVSACEKKGLEFSKDGKPVYVLLETHSVTPFAFLRVQTDTYLFGFFDSDYQIIADSIIKYNH
jgi:hypothetical protein